MKNRRLIWDFQITKYLRVSALIFFVLRKREARKSSIKIATSISIAKKTLILFVENGANINFLSSDGWKNYSQIFWFHDLSESLFVHWVWAVHVHVYTSATGLVLAFHYLASSHCRRVNRIIIRSLSSKLLFLIFLDKIEWKMKKFVCLRRINNFVATLYFVRIFQFSQRPVNVSTWHNRL